MGENNNLIWWCVYVGVLAWRFQGLRRILGIPQFHGPDFFFNVRVGEEFYRTEPGLTWVREFRRRLTGSRLVELAFAVAVGFWSHWNLTYLLLLQAPGTILTAWWQIRTSKVFALRARTLQPQDTAPPVATANLTPRQPVAYRSAPYDWSIGGMTLAGLALLVYGYLHQDQEDARHFFFGPAILLYMQAGLLLAQRGLMQAALFQISAENPAPFVRFREEYRLWWMRVCDLVRIFAAGPLLLWGIASVLPGEQAGSRVIMWGFLVLCSAMAALIIRETNRCVAAARAAGPNRQAPSGPSLPDSRIIAGVFCWERDLPRLFIKGARHYALNLANSSLYAYAAYFAGFAVLAMWAPK